MPRKTGVLMNSFIKMMNGTIRVESEYGVGSEFIVTIMQKKMDDRKIQKKKWNNYLMKKLLM